MSASVFVGNLNYQTTEAELSEHFSDAGTVLSARIPLDRESGRPRGFGFVEFESEEMAERAVAQFHDAELGGRRLRVNKAESRPQRPSGPRAPRPQRSYDQNPMENAPEMDFSQSDRPGKGRRDGWRSLRGKKRSL
ncbi:MAG: RNA-binding protein [bacterium]|nr:RNA-binding protein [bacterium]